MKKISRILFVVLSCFYLTSFAYNEKIYMEDIPRNMECFIGADIGGTNSDFGIFYRASGSMKLVLSLHMKSKKIANFSESVKSILEYLKNKYQITIKYSSFAAAGVVSENRDFCKVTNAGFYIDAREIIKNTDIEHVIIANDFEVIGFGVDSIDSTHLIQVNKGKKTKKGTRAIIGAGTGLGKCIMHWDNRLNRYVSIPTEGGHADFAPQDQCEYELTEFIRRETNKTKNVSWEDILSGRGIVRLYAFFCYKDGVAERYMRAREVFQHIDTDEQSKKTYNLFAKIYARCAKNFALDTLSVGGVYIAGGIAAKHPEMFKKESFMQEFIKSEKHRAILSHIPIYVIADYNISIYGAVNFMAIELLSEK